MAAGLGFKTFTTGEVLTAGDTNGYLMQGINVFATEAARNSAITSPQEGQFAFTKDTNSLWYYSGTAWVASGATGDIEGVTAGIGISGGGTSGTVTVTNSMATAIDAKGDLVAGTGADAFSRIAVGANDTVLTADSAQATGLKWATVAGGSLTLLSTTSLTGQNVTVTGISQSYKNLIILIYGVLMSVDTFAKVQLRTGSALLGVTLGGFAGSSQITYQNDTDIYINGGLTAESTDPTNNYQIYVSNYTSTTLYKRSVNLQGSFFTSSFACTPISMVGQINDAGTTLNAVHVDLNSTNTFSGGTLEIWGVN